MAAKLHIKIRTNDNLLFFLYFCLHFVLISIHLEVMMLQMCSRYSLSVSSKVASSRQQPGWWGRGAAPRFRSARDCCRLCGLGTVLRRELRWCAALSTLCHRHRVRRLCAYTPQDPGRVLRRALRQRLYRSLSRRTPSFRGWLRRRCS